MAGAPKGNSNARRGKVAHNALLKALAKDSGEPVGNNEVRSFKVLVEIWQKQISKALEGDNGSCQMIVERLDGKPKQAVVGGDEDDSPIMIKRIERAIVDPSDSNG